MSGGHFEYSQYKFEEIADEIERIIANNNVKPEPDQWGDSYTYSYPDDIIESMKEAVIACRRAFVYAHRIDWLHSGDDGEDSFRKRLKQDLDKIQD